MAFVHNQEWHFDNYDSVLWRPNWNVDKLLIHVTCPCTLVWESSYISALILKDVSVRKQLRVYSALSIQRRPYCFSREEKGRGRRKEGVEKRTSHCAKMLGLYRPLGTWLQLETLFLPSISIHTLQLRSTIQALVAMVTGGARAAVMEGEPSEGLTESLECGLTSNTPNSLSLYLSLCPSFTFCLSLRWRSWRCVPSALKARCFLLSLCCCEHSNSQGALHLSDSRFVLTFFWWAHKCVCVC